MDYKAFFADVQSWIAQVNQQAARLGMGSSAFWEWAASSAAELSVKYNEHPLAVKQMVMMLDWLEDVHYGRHDKRG